MGVQCSKDGGRGRGEEQQEEVGGKGWLAGEDGGGGVAGEYG